MSIVVFNIDKYADIEELLYHSEIFVLGTSRAALFDGCKPS